MVTFSDIYEQLRNESRLLIEAELRPVQGDRFQPTGFPNLGAATYKRPDGTPMLIVESAQSMANRLEDVCWDKEKDEIVETLKGLSYVTVTIGNGQKTSTLQEAHRLNSPYIVNKIKDQIEAEVGKPDEGVLDIRKLAKAVFRLDANSVLHGVFLEKIAGRLRLQRILSSFIEAEGIQTVASGGVKLDRIDPKGSAKEGYGNVPFSRTEFTAKRVIAYFNLDLVSLRSYGLKECEQKLLVALALFKIRSFLKTGLRLRTACDFDLVELRVTRPAGLCFSTQEPTDEDLDEALKTLIKECEFGNSTRKL